MDLSAIIDEFNRRKAQAGQRISDMFTPPKKPADWFQQMQQGQNAVITPQQRTNIHKELADIAERMAAGMVPEPIRARDRAMQTDPSAAAKPFTSEEIKGITPFVTAAAPIAYHGTPHTFDKFDASKIGTGQGAQSYGHGLYFAENPAVAKDYQTSLSATRAIPDVEGIASKAGLNLSSDARIELMRQAGVNKSPSEAAQSLQYASRELRDVPATTLSKVIEDYRTARASGGNMYQVNIPDQHAARMLDWDKPLSEQPEIIKALANSKILPHGVDANTGRMTGEQFHNWLEKFYNKPQGDLSKALNDAGIPGIKYLDQGSRTAGQGTHNFVVFDPAILEDVTRK